MASCGSPEDSKAAVRISGKLLLWWVYQVWTSTAKHGYLLGFWFWLDTISTLSLLLDIPAVQSGMTHAGASREDKVSSVLRAAVRAFQLIRISRLLKVPDPIPTSFSSVRASAPIQSISVVTSPCAASDCLLASMVAEALVLSDEVLQLHETRGNHCMRLQHT